MTVFNRGEIPGSGGFTYDIDEEPENGCYQVMVDPPSFYCRFAFSEEMRNDDARLQAVIENAADELVDEILRNPLVAERVERVVFEAERRGFNEAARKLSGYPYPRMGW